MYRTIQILLSVALLIVFQFPGNVSACTMHGSAKAEKEMSCCTSPSSETDAPDQQGDCCKTTDTDTDCSGSCGQSSCHSSSSSTFWMLDLKQIENGFPSEKEKLYSLYRQPCYSAGVHSIWQPPRTK